MPTRSQQVIDGLRALQRVRRLERVVGPDVRAEIADVREFLEHLAGPTVRPADAARALGITRPSLQRWIDKGEIGVVHTPGGRREIPLAELLDLLDEVDQIADEADRPVGRVIRERKRRAADEIDLDRLLPRKRGRDHRTAELQSLAYHRLVAERLDEPFVDEARRRLRHWRREGRIDPRWADEWESILSRPLALIADAISADSPRARELRQSSPFAGALTEQERQLLVKAVEDRAAT